MFHHAYVVVEISIVFYDMHIHVLANASVDHYCYYHRSIPE
jgi:hypothetical protein